MLSHDNTPKQLWFEKKGNLNNGSQSGRIVNCTDVVGNGDERLFTRAVLQQVKEVFCMVHLCVWMWVGGRVHTKSRREEQVLRSE